MATKKSIWILVGCFVITSWLLGFVIEVQAETLKCRTLSVTVKQETMPVSDAEGHTLGMSLNEGLASFENAEVANFKAQLISDSTPGKAFQAIGYNFFTFEDGATIITKFERRSTTDQSGIVSTKSVGEIIKGTGRFEGIKGTYSGIGKVIRGGKGEANKSTNDITFTYTLPPK